MRLTSWLVLPLVAVLGLSGPHPAHAAGDTLAVVTLNLWHDSHDWPKRLQVMLPELKRLRPDVLCLQEVLQHAGLPNQAATLAESLGYQMTFASVDPPGAPKRYGNAVLTPHRVLTTGETHLEPADDYRVAAHLRFAWRGRVVDAYSTHLHHTREGGAIRARQVRHLLAYVDSTRGKGPVVLGGDFNCEPETPEMAPLVARWADAYRAVHPHAAPADAVTFNPLMGAGVGAIDHVYVERAGRRRLVPVACEILLRTPGADSVWASDHFGVLARLRSER